MQIPDYRALLLLSPEDGMAAIAAAFRDYTRMLDHGIGLWPASRARQCLEAFSALLGSGEPRSAEDAGRSTPVGAPVPAPAVRIALNECEVRPSADAFRERLLRNFTRSGVPKGERLESLTVQLHIGPEEPLPAAVAVEVPVLEPCRNCSGTGHVDFFRCTLCGGRGWIESAAVVHERIGPAAALERSLLPFGIENCYLRIEAIGA